MYFPLCVDICYHLQAVANSFPDTALDTVNSAFFLRFISPAIGEN